MSHFLSPIRHVERW
jgi:uncharacterized protein YndB with AHSA1/START domain